MKNWQKGQLPHYIYITSSLLSRATDMLVVLKPQSVLQLPWETQRNATSINILLWYRSYLPRQFTYILDIFQRKRPSIKLYFYLEGESRSMKSLESGVTKLNPIHRVGFV